MLFHIIICPLSDSVLLYPILVFLYNYVLSCATLYYNILYSLSYYLILNILYYSHIIILFYTILNFYDILYYYILLPYFISFCTIVHPPILSILYYCTILCYYSNSLLLNTILQHSLLSYLILSFLYYSLLFCTIHQDSVTAILWLYYNSLKAVPGFYLLCYYFILSQIFILSCPILYNLCCRHILYYYTLLQTILHLTYYCIL